MAHTTAFSIMHILPRQRSFSVIHDSSLFPLDDGSRGTGSDESWGCSPSLSALSGLNEDMA